MASEGFRPMNEKLLVEYVKATPSLAAKLGEDLDNLQIKEIGDGNLNFVFIVISPSGSIVVKQALPYARCIGEEWPMAKERAYFEASTLQEQRRLCPDHVPEVYHFDRTMCLIGMRYIEPPHIILRKGLIAGIEYPLLAEQLTEQVVFSDPYKVSKYNRHTSPYLDADAMAVREDNILKLEIAELKSKFCERTQALIHGDLHTGSVMVTKDSTQVIDPEFSFYAPMGFDIGAYIGNLILAYFSQDGHDKNGDRKAYKLWILNTISGTWNLFHKKFTTLWDKHKDGPGEAYLPGVYNNAELQKLAKVRYMQDLFHDMLGFGAAKMIRRIVGVAHVEDFESIKEPSKRAECERKALNVAKTSLKERRKFQGISEVISVIENVDV